MLKEPFLKFLLEDAGIQFHWIPVVPVLITLLKHI